jgi:hypothetical protein
MKSGEVLDFGSSRSAYFMPSACSTTAFGFTTRFQSMRRRRTNSASARGFGTPIENFDAMVRLLAYPPTHGPHPAPRAVIDPSPVAFNAPRRREFPADRPG